MADCLNHRPGAARYEWRRHQSDGSSSDAAEGEEYFALISNVNYNAGDQVFNDYGPRSNAFLAANYGFVLHSNVCDHIDFIVGGDDTESVATDSSYSDSDEEPPFFESAPEHGRGFRRFRLQWDPETDPPRTVTHGHEVCKGRLQSFLARRIAAIEEARDSLHALPAGRRQLVEAFHDAHLHLLTSHIANMESNVS